MKTTLAVLFVVLALLVVGALFLRSFSPDTFDKLTSGNIAGIFSPTPPAAVTSVHKETSAPTKPKLPAQLAAPAVNALKAENARVDAALHPAENALLPAPLPTVSAAGVQTGSSPAPAPAAPLGSNTAPAAAKITTISPSAPSAAPVSAPSHPQSTPTPPAASASSAPASSTATTSSAMLQSQGDLINAPVTPTAPAPSSTASTGPAASTPIGPAAPPENAAASAEWNLPSPTPAQPHWSWTTTDGQTYKNVKVIKMDPESVTILHEDGGARIPMASLPPDLQKMFNYNPIAASQWAIGALVTGNLVMLKNGSMQPVPDAAIRPIRYFAIYYSASWCPPCETFTPKLVKFYSGFKPIHSDFEVILVSEDKDPLAMAAYMRDEGMPWPAVSFGALVHPPGKFKAPGIENYAGDGIPDLVLVDSTGKVLSDSYRNGKYVGPEAVMDDIPSLVP